MGAVRGFASLLLRPVSPFSLSYFCNASFVSCRSQPASLRHAGTARVHEGEMCGCTACIGVLAECRYIKATGEVSPSFNEYLNVSHSSHHDVRAEPEPPPIASLAGRARLCGAPGRPVA